MPYLTTFTDVGRSKFCGEKRTEDAPSYEGLLSAIRGKLMSSEIDFLYNPEELESFSEGKTTCVNGFITAAGWRPVGKFKVEKDETDKKEEPTTCTTPQN